MNLACVHIISSTLQNQLKTLIQHFAVILRSTVSKTEQAVNRPIAQFCIRDDLNVIATRLRLPKTKLFYMQLKQQMQIKFGKTYGKAKSIFIALVALIVLIKLSTYYLLLIAQYFSTYIAQLKGQQLALGSQRFPVRVWLLAMCRGQLSAVNAGFISVFEAGESGRQKTQIEKKYFCHLQLTEN